MSDPRDDLAARLRQAEEDPPESGETYEEWAKRMVGVVIAAGWIKPPTVIPSHDIDPNVIRNTCGQFIEWDDTTQRWVHA